ncbi:MAG: histidine phosphatase family protein [Rhodoferax sp.]|nr:histidine phosphatase family protein [Rhodoferax sp.]
MGTLYLVRHGQASLGADDYDNLSALGQRQSQRLGEYLAAKGLKFDAVLTGSLKRHAQTWAGIQQGMAEAAAGLAPQVWPGLNEYDSDAVIRSLRAGPQASTDTTEGYRDHFRLLRQGLQQWAKGELSPPGMPTYADFAAGVVGALDHVRSQYSGNVLLVSSGGPIATAVAQILGTPPEGFVELNMRIRNTAVSEFAFNPKRHALLTFNTLPHLDAPEYADRITYA